ETVESFLDAVLAIQEHIDPHLRTEQANTSETEQQTQGLYNMVNTKQPSRDSTLKQREEKDLLLFIEQHSSILKDWQCDILTTVREEMQYFWPQLETKIMNEGWATYWHQRIMRELPLSDEELIEYAKLNASVVQKSTTSLNPYYLGLKLFEYIERTYNNPTKEMKLNGVESNSGRSKLFEVRTIDHDTSFIRNYLTAEFAQEEDLFVFEKQAKLYRI